MPEPSSSAPLQIVIGSAWSDKCQRDRSVRQSRRIQSLSTGSLPSQIATTFCVGIVSDLAATFKLIVFAALRANGAGKTRAVGAALKIAVGLCRSPARIELATSGETTIDGSAGLFGLRLELRNYSSAAFQ